MIMRLNACAKFVKDFCSGIVSCRVSAMGTRQELHSCHDQLPHWYGVRCGKHGRYNTHTQINL